MDYFKIRHQFSMMLHGLYEEWWNKRDKIPSSPLHLLLGVQLLMHVFRGCYSRGFTATQIFIQGRNAQTYLFEYFLQWKQMALPMQYGHMLTFIYDKILTKNIEGQDKELTKEEHQALMSLSDIFDKPLPPLSEKPPTQWFHKNNTN